MTSAVWFGVVGVASAKGNFQPEPENELTQRGEKDPDRGDSRNKVSEIA